MKTFVLKPQPPFRLDLTVWTLRRRPENAIDDWDGRVYRRVFADSDSPLLVEVSQLAAGTRPRLSVAVHCDAWSPELQNRVTSAIERLLGIRVDMKPFYLFVADDPKLGPLAERFQGMKPPRYPSLFECLSNAIACQQVSLASGIQLLNRFAQRFGQPFDALPYRRFAFPRPTDLADTNIEDLRQIGFSRQKATAILNLAAVTRNGHWDYARFQDVTDDDCITTLCELRGIGRWSAEYALLRGLGRLHVFPGDDVGARNNLYHWLELSTKLDYEAVARTLQQWKPFAGLIYFHLLLDKLALNNPGEFHVQTQAED
ncbi:DNA-3-methyladenine glycosylase [Novipirellula galeiformis]|uniref:DNA-3-methyladenine glycosylase II n=1 Tax=Novipirellula galeiformis TaxID=2528004 RepID=A0A5C6CH32_9BACT|nr:DNA-3-methyladenine glycosylase [Novipirellula galeiformis]TWU22039.1 DNA-3-methyladenine glycosylase [Novipirellula galeiformis]